MAKPSATTAMPDWEALFNEFKGREAPKQLMIGIRLHAGMTDADIVYRKLVEHLDYESRRFGVKAEGVTTFAETFDFGRGAGVGYHARVKADPNASPLVYIVSKYRDLAFRAEEERDRALSLLRIVLSSRSLASVKKKLRKAITN